MKVNLLKLFMMLMFDISDAQKGATRESIARILYGE